MQSGDREGERKEEGGRDNMQERMTQEKVIRRTKVDQCRRRWWLYRVRSL